MGAAEDEAEKSEEAAEDHASDNDNTPVDFFIIKSIGILYLVLTVGLIVIGCSFTPLLYSAMTVGFLLSETFTIALLTERSVELPRRPYGWHSEACKSSCYRGGPTGGTRRLADSAFCYRG